MMDPRTRARGILDSKVLGQMAIILGIALFCVVAPVSAGETATAGGAAMRMYRDPDTGVIGVPSPDAVGAPVADEKVVANPPPALEREPVLAPPGGVKVNLQGRYHAIVTRHMNDSGPGGHKCVQTGAAAR